MKIQITQRFVYHKVGTIEIEINKEDYKKYNSLNEYLTENQYLWEEKIDNATSDSYLYSGNGCYENGFNEEESETETRFDCKELQTGGHL